MYYTGLEQIKDQQNLKISLPLFEMSKWLGIIQVLKNV